VSRRIKIALRPQRHLLVSRLPRKSNAFLNKALADSQPTRLRFNMQHIKPYGPLGFQHLPESVAGTGLNPGWSCQCTGGVDVKVGLRSNLVANATVNTDFADANVDLQNFNLLVTLYCCLATCRSSKHIAFANSVT